MIVGIVNPVEDISTKLKLAGIEVKTLLRSEKNADEVKELNPDILICRNRDDISRFVDDCSNLKFIFIVEVGLEKLPFEKLITHNIRVANTSGISCEVMSNYAMACILNHAVRLKEDYDNKQKHIWKKYQCTDNLNNKSLLIVGAGRTGSAIAKKAKAFGLKTMGIVRNKRQIDSFDEVGTLQDLDVFLSKSDYVVCVMPLTPETYYLFDKKRFSQMRQGSVFINISRGALVNEQALLETIEKKLLDSVYLDVFEVEPLPDKHVFWDNPKIIVTPHQSGRLADYMDKAMDIFRENYNAYCKGDIMPNEVHLEQRY